MRVNEGASRRAIICSVNLYVSNPGHISNFRRPELCLQNGMSWNRDRARASTVCVIIICFNYGLYVTEAVASVLAQTFQDFEIIVIEGGSTDGMTKEVVRSLASTRRLRTIFQPRGKTIGENRLTGLLAASAKYVVFLDADDLFESSYLEKAVSMLDASGADLVTPDVKFFGNETIIETFKGLNSANVWETIGITRDIFVKNACSVSSVFKYSFWKRHDIGYCVDDNLLGDWDFWCRIAAHGGRSVHLAEPLHLYRVHGANMTFRLSRQLGKSKTAFKRRWKQFAGTSNV
jgi:glycosyltransferase involved in cell wall biosynthesis